jgi:hypothetical protein
VSNRIDIDDIRKLRMNGRLIPFVGAGLSTRFGVPSWSKLIDFIADQLDWDPEVFKLNGSYLQLAEYYVIEKGSIGPLRSEMDRMFDPTDDDVKQSKAHECLAKLRFPIIYTTNYDYIIERAFRLHSIPCHVVNNIDDIEIVSPDTTQIVKFHGTFADDNSLVLTESSYLERLEFESALDIKLRSDILGKTLMFIGYGFNDVNIRYMLYKLYKLKKAHQRIETTQPSAIMTTFSPGDVQKRLLAKWNVAVIPLDPVDKDKSVDEFLESLS